MKKTNSLDGPRVHKKLRTLAPSKRRPAKTAEFAEQLAEGLATPLTDHVKLQREFVRDITSRIPRFSWPLPRWTTQKPTLVDNVDTPPAFTPPISELHCVTLPDIGPRMTTLKNNETIGDQLDHVTVDRAVESEVGQDANEPLTRAPHPDSDFTHVDPGVYNDDERQALLDAIAAMEGIEGLARRDGDLAEDIAQANEPLAHARGLLAADPRGMQRLKLVFEWILCHVTAIFGEINAALDNDDLALGKFDYNQALDRYIELLRDLDDHDPHTQGPPEPGKRGYGITIKSPYILPLIFGGRIHGATVEVKWNPHLSSSGIPIPHE